MPPLGLYFPLLPVNIEQIPLIRGIFIGQTQSNPNLLLYSGVVYRWGNTLIGALFIEMISVDSQVHITFMQIAGAKASRIE